MPRLRPLVWIALFCAATLIADDPTAHSALARPYTTRPTSPWVTIVWIVGTVVIGVAIALPVACYRGPTRDKFVD